MGDENTSIRVENLSKCYRIGLEDELEDSFASTLIDIVRRPLKNYRTYRSLYRFDDLKPGNGDERGEPKDVIWALKNVSFEVKPGEVLGIIGRNGAGKSTLLKILSRITPPSGGHAEIRGKVSSLLEVGTGFHHELTGRENIYLNATILGMKKSEVDRKFDEIVSFSGVEKFIDTPVKRYSSGMTVRLAFSVAAHLEPEILVIDEVLAVGDAYFQRKCLNKMQEVGQQGRTVLFVSHSMPAISRLCQRAILLDRGGVVADGPSAQVVASYMSSGLGTTAAREWPDPATAPSGKVARLRAVRVRSEEGEVLEAMDIRKPVAIEMEFDVLKDGHVLMPHYYFTNEEGVRLFGSLDTDPDWRRRARPRGRYVSTTWIPGNYLSEGSLFVSAALHTLDPNVRQFHEQDVVVFQVVDSIEGDTARGDWHGVMKGVIRPLLKWETKYFPAGDDPDAPLNLS